MPNKKRFMYEREDSMDKMILTDETDIFAFFEVIDQVEASSILDVGMFLKRIGSVSRQIKEKEIYPNQRLTGVDFFPEISCPVWEKIYDDIYKPDEIFWTENTNQYELAVVLQLEEHMEKNLADCMWQWMSGHVSYILTDWDMKKIENRAEYKNSLEIRIDDKIYHFLIM